jgi:hypothetical protein
MEIKKEFWNKLVKKKKQPWKTDKYYGIKGENYHAHETVSGAILVKGKLIGGETYYYRDVDGNILINKDEKGKDLI